MKEIGSVVLYRRLMGEFQKIVVPNPLGINETGPEVALSGYPVGVTSVTGIDITALGVVSYKFKIDDGEWSAILPVSRHIIVEDIGEGQHTVYVCGCDGAGKWQSEERATARTWTVDTSVPSALLFGLPGSITSDTGVAISVGGDDVTRYEFRLDEGSWTSSPAGEPITISFLDDGVHALYVKGCNGVGTWQENPTIYTWCVDTMPPDAVSELNAIAPPGTTVIKLMWPAPADAMSGVCRYHIKYATSEITPETWAAAGEVWCGLIPLPPGTEETFLVKMPNPGATYYFVLKSEDIVGNLSLMSNIATATTEPRLPKVTGIMPGTGDNRTAVDVTITGSNFSGGSSNSIRFISSDNVFDVKSDTGTETEITAEIPAGVPPGTYNIRVINENGASLLSDAAYTIISAAIPLPVVTNVSPPIAGNNADSNITITGENFAGATDVILNDGVNSAPVQSFSIISEKEITATVPGGLDEGFYDILVTTANGANAVSAVKFRVSSPLIIDNDTADDKAVAQVIHLSEEMNGYLPVRVTLKTEEAEKCPVVCDWPAEIEAVIETGTRITTEDGNSYSGDINPPVQVKVTEEIAALCGSENVVVFQMGNPTERLNLSENMLVVLTVTRDTAAGAPEVYYLESDGSLTPAGLHGTKNGKEYKEGGTVLVTREDVPEEGKTTYTIGLLLDHMSTFVVGNVAHDDGGGNDDDRCFIATAAYGSPLEPHVKILREFRDTYLLSNSMGQGFVDAYYRYSPPIADFIAKHNALRSVVRVGLMPAVGMSYVALHGSACQKFFILFVLFGVIWMVIILSKRRRVVTL